MKIIHIVTGKETLKVNEKDQIGGGANQVTFSDSWRMMGAVEFRFGRVVRQYTMEDVRAGTVPWKYKNGKQRCFVKDYDHGSFRVQMSPKLHDVMITEEK